MDVPENLQGIGIPYFSEAEWTKAKRLMADAHTFHDTYAEFTQRVAQAERELRAKGVATVRVPLNVDTFIAWCGKTGRKVDSQARAAYAAIAAHKQDQAG